MPTAHIIVTGINHRTATLCKRSLYAWDNTTKQTKTQLLRKINTMTEFFILTTCNRTEIICIATQQTKELKQQLKALIPEKETYQYMNHDAVKHILRTLCGLDSMLIGEVEVLGQYKSAIKAIHQAPTKKTLSQTIHKLIHKAKIIRTQSKLPGQGIKLSDLVIKQIHTHNNLVKSHKFLCIGAGEVIQRHLQPLYRVSQRAVTVACRAPEKHKNTHMATYVKLTSPTTLIELIKQHDYIISATTAQKAMITTSMLQQIDLQNKLFIDLAVPCDIDPSPSLTTLKRIHLDDLRNTQVSKAALHHAETLCAQSAELLFEAFDLDQYTDAIKVFRAEWFSRAKAIINAHCPQTKQQFALLKNAMQSLCQELQINTKLPEPPNKISKYS